MTRTFSHICLIAACLMPGCSAAPDLSGLSHTDAEAHAVLEDQLERLAGISSMRQMEIQFCVFVFEAGQGEQDVDPRLLHTLRAAMPRELDATLIPMSKCRSPQGVEVLAPDGEVALLLGAIFDPERSPSEGQWSAASGCTVPCGHLDRYRVHWRNMQPVAELVTTERVRRGPFLWSTVPI
jgi:hypothetical protein